MSILNWNAGDVLLIGLTEENVEAGIISSNDEIKVSVEDFFRKYTTQNNFVTKEELQNFKKIFMTEVEKEELQEIIQKSDTEQIKEKLFAISVKPAENEDSVTEEIMKKNHLKIEREIDTTRSVDYFFRTYSKYEGLEKGDYVIIFDSSPNTKLKIFPPVKCHKIIFVNDKISTYHFIRPKGLQPMEWDKIKEYLIPYGYDGIVGEIKDNKKEILGLLDIIFN